MKILTYEDLKPHLTAENRLWTEDDATMHSVDHENISFGWVNTFGCNCPKFSDAVAKSDWGDAGAWVFADGRVAFWACDGGAIFQISDEGMRALGLAAPEPRMQKFLLPGFPDGQAPMEILAPNCDATMTPLTDDEFAETGLPESMRDFAFWDDEGWLVTVHCHKAVLDRLTPVSSRCLRRSGASVLRQPYPK